MKNKEKTELIPELRFGGFPIKNWDEKKLQDIFIYLSTNTYSRNLLNNRQGIYQNIHYGDILVKYGSIIDAQKEEIPYINEDIECTTDNIIMDGDIVIADTAEDEIVGKTSEIFNIGDKKILSGLHINPAKRKATPIKNEKRFSEQKRKAMKIIKAILEIVSPLLLH